MKFIYRFEASAEQKQLLRQHLFNENIQRCKLFAKIVILFEALLIAMNMGSSYALNGSLFTWNVYIVMYVLLLSASVFMLLYIRAFEQKETYTSQQYNRFRAGLLSLVVFFLVWGAVVTLFDQRGYGHVMAFAINFMCVSILFHASNRTILCLYILPVAVLIIGLPFFQSSSTVLMGHYINLSVFLFFCWLASRMLYWSYSANFYNRMLLTETNENLAIKIQENEKINAQLADANERLKQLTLIDELTKIPNRRGFHQYIKQAFHHPKGTRKLSILMIDIDAFKPFNDNYGHLKGDIVIESVAQAIKRCVDSANSIAARFGGEEFIVAMFDADPLKVYQIAEAIRLSVFELNIPHDYSPVSPYVTASIGAVTEEIISEEEVEQLIAHADDALYKAKTQGRNRVENFQNWVEV
ncbi:GGDEF domain-containing protein [Priestia abyssalis]|uniref:GGDEF domain-containing protein n=1 Tax=Priestia abyssalis TaxID=1221450 RepID=UPI001475D8D3|nr:GGDEF domain-containing protein [Priestia abyssalis]